ICSRDIFCRSHNGRGYIHRHRVYVQPIASSSAPESSQSTRTSRAIPTKHWGRPYGHRSRPHN
ncbi:hypothetical protein FRC06_000775, partial [Ceratobasidium sp. 370]